MYKPVSAMVEVSFGVYSVMLQPRLKLLKAYIMQRTSVHFISC